MKNCFTIILLLTSILLTGQDSPGIYTVKNAKINTLDSDFGTAFYGDDKVVFAAPKQGFTFSREENSGQPFLDLYVGEVTEDGQIIKKQKLPGEINTKYHEGMVSFTKDLKTVYFSANNFVKQKKKKNKKKATGFLHLFRASITESGEWINLTMLPFNGEKFSTGHPVLNRDDTQLYFVSDRPESYGKTDLFVVDINEDGSFGEPRNLGSKINTADREMFPFIGKDNVLYYSSDGLSGLGELDVFASKIFDNSQSEPMNLQEPVNSEFDDFAYIIDDHKNRGYFSSNRDGGHGDDDIYTFVASPPIYIECLQEIQGVVMDIDTQELIPDAMIILFDEQGKELESFISNSADASFSFQQNCNSSYTIKGYLEGYLIGELDIQTVNDLDAEPIEIIFNLTRDPDKDKNTIVDADGSESQNDVEDEISVEQTAVVQSDPATTEASVPATNNQKGMNSGANQTVVAAAVVSGSQKDESDPQGNATVSTVADSPMDSHEDKDVYESSTLVNSNEDVNVNDPVKDVEIAEESDEKAAYTNSTTDPLSDAELETASVVESEASVAKQEELNTNATSVAEEQYSDTSETNTPESVNVSNSAIAMNTSDVSEEGEKSNTTSQAIEAGAEGIKINTIYFDYDKFDIRVDAKIELDKIAVVMEQNPKAKIKVNSHTDIRGKKAYNLKLSNHRARKTVEYLLNKGIDEDRITGEGHGELEVAEICTKEKPCNGLQHQLNRRSEFLLIDSFSEAVIAQSINKSASGNYAVNDNVSNSGAYINYDFRDNKEVYTVQVGAFKGKVQSEKYKKLTDLFNYRYEDGLNRYFAGIFESSEDARSYMRKMRKDGFTDAFVVGLKGTDRF